jgi:hypothetical protein
MLTFGALKLLPFVITRVIIKPLQGAVPCWDIHNEAPMIFIIMITI